MCIHLVFENRPVNKHVEEEKKRQEREREGERER